MLKGLSAVCLTLFSLVSGFAQDKEDPQQVLDKALVLQMELKVMDRNAKPVMSFKMDQVVISGEVYPLKLDGRTIRGTILLTPYEEQQGKVLLVAQVQLWILEPSAEDWKYVTSLKSIPAALNEKMRFFPLGLSDPAGPFANTANIQIDITVGHYKDYMEKMKAPLSPRPPDPSPKDDGSNPS